MIPQRMRKAADFDRLCSSVYACRNCKRMEQSVRVLSRSSGSLDAPLMFVGEAPGRLGADSSEIPFHGDKTGHNFEELLAQVGINRYSIFVTNAVLCNPKNEKGNNAPPNRQEIANCSNFLRQQIELIDPKIVVTLGVSALYALSLIDPHGLTLPLHVRTANRWFGRLLIPAYHPSQRAMIHRSLANQLSDYQFIVEKLRRLDRKQQPVSGDLRNDIYAVVDLITRLKPELSYFALHKLFYLAELRSMNELGQRLTSAFIIRQKDGPYCTDLHAFKLRKAFPDMKIAECNGRPTLVRNTEGFFDTEQDQCSKLPAAKTKIVLEVVNKYGSVRDSRLKTVVYLTRPMRTILQTEKDQKINMFNSPIDFSTVQMA